MTLVLGMAISVAALRHMLPAKAADVLQAKEFRLMQVNTPPAFIQFSHSISVCSTPYRERYNMTDLQEPFRPATSCIEPVQDRELASVCGPVTVTFSSLCVGEQLLQNRSTAQR